MIEVNTNNTKLTLTQPLAQHLSIVASQVKIMLTDR
jgi:hypothetical protein